MRQTRSGERSARTTAGPRAFRPETVRDGPTPRADVGLPLFGKVALPLVLVVFAAFLLAGCVVFTGSTVKCADYVASNPGAGTLAIVVTVEPGGPPLAGAQVTLDASGTCWARSERATTGSDGVVSWRFPVWGSANVIVEAPNMTRERVEDVPVARDNDTFTQTVPLFRSRLDWATTRSFSAQPPGALPVIGGGDTGWDGQPIAWEADRATMREYAKRLVRIDAWMQWNNTPTAFADLAIGLGGRPDRADFVFDSDADQGGSGTFSESGSLGPRAMYDAGWSEATEVLIGALSAKPHVALSPGIPYTLLLSAFFSSPQNAQTPMSSWILVAAIALGAIALRRKGGRSR